MPLVEITVNIPGLVELVEEIKNARRDIVATLEEVQAKAQSLDDKLTVAVTAIQAIQQIVTDLRNTAGLPADAQAKVDQLGATLDEATGKLDTLSAAETAIETPPTP